MPVLLNLKVPQGFLVPTLVDSSVANNVHCIVIIALLCLYCPVPFFFVFVQVIPQLSFTLLN